MALASLFSLRATTNPENVHVLLTEDVSTDMRKAFEKLGASVDVYKPLPWLDTQKPEPRRLGTFLKLFLWTYTQYDQVAFLDADTIIQRDASSLFDIATSDFTVLQGDWPDKNFLPYGIYLNTGVFVLRPSLEDFGRLINHYRKGDWLPTPDVTEQDLLTFYFKDRFGVLPAPYNHRPPGNCNKITPKDLEQIQTSAIIYHYRRRSPCDVLPDWSTTLKAAYKAIGFRVNVTGSFAAPQIDDRKKTQNV